MPNGRELLFFSGKGDALTLCRTVLSKTSDVRRFPVTSHASGGNKLAVSLQMNRLAYAQIHSDVDLWRLELTDNGRIQSPPVPFISSTKPDFEPEYSPDGRRIAFTSSRSGVNQIWVCDSDGLNPVQLTSYGGEVLYGPRWSRDGQQIGFNVEGLKGAPTQIYVVNANGGRPQRLQTPTAWAQWPNWSHDGQWIYFASVNEHHDVQVWKMRTNGKDVVQLTRNGGDKPQESPDGKAIYFDKGWPEASTIWTISVNGGEEARVLDSVGNRDQWRVGPKGIYYMTLGDNGHPEIRFYDFLTRKSRILHTMPRQSDMGISISPDSRSILYPQYDEGGADLMLVENFK
jgi:Tol biopolymer transport system component